MSGDVVLLLLRVFGAFLLFCFVGGISWLIYRDMQVTAESLAQKSQPIGSIQLITPNQAEPMLYSLLPVTTIGRSATNLVIIEDEFASNEHALLIRRGEQWWLEDLDSRNGTLLNDAVLAETAVVTPSDIITIGNTQLKIAA
ncbi:MAG: FHA domain-containing protein [Chloroflexota bacterium]